MYSKKKTEHIINKYAPLFIKKLRLDPRKITFSVLKEEGLGNIRHWGDCTLEDNCTINIYYNRHNTQKQIISTLIHELLHRKFYKLKKRYKLFAAEEHFVRNIEEMYIEALYYNVLMLYSK